MEDNNKQVIEKMNGMEENLNENSRKQNETLGENLLRQMEEKLDRNKEENNGNNRQMLEKMNGMEENNKQLKEEFRRIIRCKCKSINSIFHR